MSSKSRMKSKRSRLVEHSSSKKKLFTTFSLSFPIFSEKLTWFGLYNKNQCNGQPPATALTTSHHVHGKTENKVSRFLINTPMGHINMSIKYRVIVVIRVWNQVGWTRIPLPPAVAVWLGNHLPFPSSVKWDDHSVLSHTVVEELKSVKNWTNILNTSVTSYNQW